MCVGQKNSGLLSKHTRVTSKGHTFQWWSEKQNFELSPMLEIVPIMMMMIDQPIDRPNDRPCLTMKRLFIVLIIVHSVCVCVCATYYDDEKRGYSNTPRGKRSKNWTKDCFGFVLTFIFPLFPFFHILLFCDFKQRTIEN